MTLFGDEPPDVRWPCRYQAGRRCTHPGCDPARRVGPQAVARRTDPGTSWQAARSVDRIRESQAQVLAILRRYGPMTDEEIASVAATWPEGTRQSPSGLRTRRAELVDLGVVKDSGLRGKTRSGRSTIVWEAAP